MGRNTSMRKVGENRAMEEEGRKGEGEAYPMMITWMQVVTTRSL